MMKHWMFRCSDVSQKVSQSMDCSLPFHHRMAIRFHLMMCRYCAQARKQMMMIRKMCRSDDSLRFSDEHGDHLPSETKARIKKMLRPFI